MTILCPRHIFAYFCTLPKKSIRFKLGTICCLVVFIFSPFISSRLPALRIQYIAELFILSSFRVLFLKFLPLPSSLPWLAQQLAGTNSISLESSPTSLNTHQQDQPLGASSCWTKTFYLQRKSLRKKIARI